MPTTEQFYYLSLASNEYIVLRGQPNTRRLGMIGATFTTMQAADEYARALNEEAQREPDSDTEGS